MLKYFIGRTNIAMEADVPPDGDTYVEKEHLIWVQLTNLNELAKAEDAEKQRQVCLNVNKVENNFCAGKVRIRETVHKNGITTYDLVIKQNHNGITTRTKTAIPCTKNCFVQMAGLCDEMSVKHRYIFPIDGSKTAVWKVDMAPDGKGGYQRWAKVELEVDDLEAELPPFPFNTNEVILPPPFGDLEQAEWEAKNKELYNTFFVKKGPLVDYVNKEPDEAPEEAGFKPDESQEDHEDDQSETPKENLNGEPVENE